MYSTFLRMQRNYVLLFLSSLLSLSWVYCIILWIFCIAWEMYYSSISTTQSIRPWMQYNRSKELTRKKLRKCIKLPLMKSAVVIIDAVGLRLTFFLSPGEWGTMCLDWLFWILLRCLTSWVWDDLRLLLMLNHRFNWLEPNCGSHSHPVLSHIWPCNLTRASLAGLNAFA